MKIGFDAVSLTQERSGVSNYLSRLVRALALADSSIEIFLFAPEKICVEYDLFIHYPHVKRVVIDLSREDRRQWASRYLPKLLAQYKVDIFHQPGGTDTAIFFPGCPSVVTVHDMLPWVLMAFKDWRKALRYKIRSLFWMHRAARILTGVEVSRKDILRLSRIPADKVAVIPYGAEVVYEAEISRKEEEEILRKYRLWGRRYVVNFSGLNHKRRNLDLVLDGFARVQREVPDDIALVFTGAIARSQGLFDRAQRKIGMLGIRERVVITGFVSEKALQVITANAEAAIVTSWCEGFPQSMVEGFASGTAVIATDRGGIAEVAGEAAVIIDPYDPVALAEGLLRLLSHEVERGLYIEKGYASIRSLTWQRTALETLAIYNSLLK